MPIVVMVADLEREMAKKKVVVIPESTKEVRPSKFFIDGVSKMIRISLDDGTNISVENDRVTVNREILTGSTGINHFNQLISADIGTLLGLSEKGVTLRELVEEVAVAILIDRGVEDEDDWEADS